MTPKISETTPYGLFRYLYNHYQVRYPDYYMFVEPLLPREAVEALEKIEVKDLEVHLGEDSWLIGIERPDLAESVQALWGGLSPLTRGNYLAGFTERTYFGCPQMESRLSFLRDQMRDSAKTDFTPEAACEIGCCLVAMGEVAAFSDLLQADVDWEQEIDRASVRDARRWKTIGKLSRRVIDIFLEAALIVKRPEAVKLALAHGANPNILVWRLERSSNGLYTALSYAIHHEFNAAVDALLEGGADPRGSDSAPQRSPLAQAFQQTDFDLIKRLLAAGASLDDGPRYTEAPLTYGLGAPVEWVEEQLADLLELLPLEAKPLFHTPHVQGGTYYTLLQCAWDDPEKLALPEEIGLDLRLTVHEMAQLIRTREYDIFCVLVGRLGESVKKEALARVREAWPDFG